MNKYTMICSIACLSLVYGCDPQRSPDVADNTDDGAGSWIVVGEPSDKGGVSSVENNEIIAQIDSKALDGAIQFIDELEVGGVGMIATDAEGVLAIQLFDQESASPLEIFMALAPAEIPPQILVDNHEHLADFGEVPAQPRQLGIERGAASYSNICNLAATSQDPANGFFTYWAEWSRGYGNINSRQLYSTSGTFYIVTNMSKKRALAACRTTSAGSSSTMTVQRYNAQTATWSDVFHKTGVNKGMFVGYRSSTPDVSTKYRERVITQSTNSYGLGISWEQ